MEENKAIGEEEEEISSTTTGKQEQPTEFLKIYSYITMPFRNVSEVHSSLFISEHIFCSLIGG